MIYEDLQDINISIEAIENDEVLSNEEKQEKILQLISLKDETLNNGLDRIMKVIKNNTAKIDSIAEEIKRLQKRKQTLDIANDRLKEYILFLMQHNNKDKVQSDLFSFSIRKTKSVNIIDESLIDETFIKIKKEIDKSAILKLLKEGEKVEGCELKEKDSLVVG